MGRTHTLAGTAAGVAVSAALSLDPAGAIVVTVVAACTSAGRWSPDADQRWPLLARPLVAGLRLVLGRARFGRWFGHRRLTHWWGIPALVAVLAATTHGPLGWVLGGIAAGWGSHIAGDAVFGRASRSRPAGVPLLPPCHRYVGVGLKVDGWTERATWAVGLPAVIVWLTGWYLGLTPTLIP